MFGSNYHGLGAVAGWLALMWSLRMIQAVPGMALMAQGSTKPFLIAGLIRANALPFVLWAALQGQPMTTLAAIGCLFESLSLIYIVQRLAGDEHGLGLVLAQRALFLIPAAGAAWLIAQACADVGSMAVLVAFAASASIGCIGATVMPSLNAYMRQRLAQTTKATAV